MDRPTKKYGYYTESHPKTIKGNRKGFGMHTYFSNETLKTFGFKEIYETVCGVFRPIPKEPIAVYGKFNDQ